MHTFFNQIDNKVIGLMPIGCNPTQWSLNGTKQYDYSDNKTSIAPGFITPFTAEHGSIEQAATTMGLLPTLYLGTAAIHAILGPLLGIFGGIYNSIKGDWNSAAAMGMLVISSPVDAIYCLGSFALTLLKEITAFITRSIATLVEMGKGQSSTENAAKPYFDDSADLHGFGEPVRLV